MERNCDTCYHEDKSFREYPCYLCSDERERDYWAPKPGQEPEPDQRPQPDQPTRPHMRDWCLTCDGANGCDGCMIPMPTKWSERDA